MTKLIKVKLDKRSYNIAIDHNIISDFPQYLEAIKSYSKIFIVTDNAVAKLHLSTVSGMLDKANLKHQSIILEAGEKTKDFANLQNLSEQILEKSIDRNSLLIALGGGVIGDLTGFVASILLRGIDFIQIPTTLLAAVDSSVGGKTAINSKYGKNLIGSFYQPKLVFCDLQFLETLKEREFLAGYAEVVKYGLIWDKKFFQYLQKNVAKIKNRDPEVLKYLVAKSCEIKAKIVAKDEKENSVRALLNFGHTFGHVFETETNYSAELLHGEAVAIGMIMGAKMSVLCGMISEKELQEIEDHFKEVGIPTSPKNIRDHWNIENLTSHLHKDKKIKNGKLTFILLKEIGKGIIKKDVSEELFLKVVQGYILG